MFTVESQDKLLHHFPDCLQFAQLFSPLEMQKMIEGTHKLIICNWPYCKALIFQPYQYAIE
jgi:hypothetical protein